MGWLSVYNFLVPTNPLDAIFFGTILIIIVSLFIWFETKSKQTTFLTLILGLVFVGIVVVIL